MAEPPDDDVVDPIDRKLHAILMRAAETLEDPQHRQQALELAVTGPSIHDLTVEELWQLYELFTLVAMRRDLEARPSR